MNQPNVPAFWPVGALEIGRMLDVEPRTVAVWRRRRLLPEPDYPEVNGHAAWRTDTIRSWAQATQRMDTDGRPVSRSSTAVRKDP